MRHLGFYVEMLSRSYVNASQEHPMQTSNPYPYGLPGVAGQASTGIMPGSPAAPGETLQSALKGLRDARTMAGVIEDRIFGPRPSAVEGAANSGAPPHLRQTATMLDLGLSDLTASLNRIAEALAL